jgi:hypothetical protein
MQLYRDGLEEAGLRKAAEGLLGVSGAEDLVVLLEHPRRCRAGDFVTQLPDRIDDGLIEGEIEPGGQREGPQHPDRVFLKSDDGVANRTDDAGPEIFEAAHVIDDGKRGDVVEERVDRKVAAERVFLGSAERIVAVQEVRVAFGRSRCRAVVFGRRHAVLCDFFPRLNLTPEGRDLDDLRTKPDVRETEAPSDDPAVPEELFDVIGMSRRPDVEVLGLSPEEEVAHAAADQIRDVIGLAQPVENLQSVGIDVTPRERVLLARDHPRFHHAGGIVPKASGATIAGMFRLAVAIAVGLAGPASAEAAQPRDPLERARALYNQHQFDAAVTAADEVRKLPQQADSADLIAARAYLERFRERAAPDDLARARERLRAITPEKFSERERTEFIVGLGETLYFERAAGAAAAVFESVLTLNGGLAGEARERVLDWWANALDQEAQPRPEIERLGVYQRIRDRMGQELAANPDSGTAPYWLAAAARGQGDLQAAWDAAQAAWVRSPLNPDRGVALRRDLEVLVQKAIVPERARILGRTPESLAAEWDAFKEQWTDR